MLVDVAVYMLLYNYIELELNIVSPPHFLL